MQRLNFNAFFARSADVVPEDHELLLALARLPAPAPTGPWLAGGALRRTVLKQPLDSDFDFFFANEDQFEAFCQNMRAVRRATQIAKNEHNVMFRVPAEEPTSVGEDEFTPYRPELLVQAIRTAWYSNITEVLDSFDFTLCQFGYDGVDLVCGDYSLWDTGRKRLVPHKITYGAASLRRLLKYTKQGFTICGGGLADFLEKVAADPAVINRETLYID